MESTVNDVRKAILEMQELIENNKEDYERHLKEEIEIISSPCFTYDQKIIEGKEKDVVDRRTKITGEAFLFLCANHLLNLTYDVEHMLIYASQDEEFIISDYKIKIIEIKLREEANISISKFDEGKGDYKLVECNGKSKLTIKPKNSDVFADEYNKDISHEYSLKNLLEKCIKKTEP